MNKQRKLLNYKGWVLKIVPTNRGRSMEWVAESKHYPNKPKVILHDNSCGDYNPRFFNSYLFYGWVGINETNYKIEQERQSRPTRLRGYCRDYKTVKRYTINPCTTEETFHPTRHYKKFNLLLNHKPRIMYEVIYYMKNIMKYSDQDIQEWREEMKKVWDKE